MLFSMGLGSRYSRKYEARLLDRFVLIEFGLSFLCTFSAMFCFWISAYTIHFGLVVYGIACMIGFMTGLEIPLITRINQTYESLRNNISSVMEYDYYGGLLGGAGGAVIGGIAGGRSGARTGAAIGGLSGGAIGGMRSSRQNRQADQQQQQWEQQQANQYMQQRSAYNRAHAACLEGRGYTVQ